MTTTVDDREVEVDCSHIYVVVQRPEMHVTARQSPQHSAVPPPPTTQTVSTTRSSSELTLSWRLHWNLSLAC